MDSETLIYTEVLTRVGRGDVSRPRINPAALLDAMKNDPLLALDAACSILRVWDAVQARFLPARKPSVPA